VNTSHGFEHGNYDLQRDQSARQRALHAHESFIVQAPAGSGKTELLIQRLLTVLADAEHPSEVLAITFTNKAAGEMLDRLQSALESATKPVTDELSPLAIKRRDLAVKVLERDAARNWHLLTDLSAVLIDTFDAFCARITSRAPLAQVAAAGALAGIADSLSSLYREAAREALFDADIRASSDVLLTLAANKVDDVIDLIANLLSRRSQWLGQAVDTSDAAIARHTKRLLDEVRHELTAVSASLNAAHQRDVGRLLAFTALSLEIAGKTDLAAERAAAAEDWATDARIKSVATWRTLSAMLLTGTGELRKPGGVNKTAGFPKHDDKDFAELAAEARTDAKQRMQALLDELVNEPAFLRALGKTRHLPTAAAIKDHAPMLQATLTVLRHAAMNLLVLLRERGVTDFGGVADAALQVLNEAREDVMAGLDARLKHVLVDEVQDTNPAQFALLSTLISDWSAGDGRTLFLVGDPMQSIYGFRDADVGLFAQAQTRGVSDVRLKPLTLSANYRSRPALIEWVNTALSRVFSRVGAWETSTVNFEAAVATRDAETAATVNRLAFANAEDEARSIAERVAQLQQGSPEETIAILVRSRPHANAIIAALAEHNVAFVAREFARWTERETIRDLLSLTYAITHPSDRLALFSVLRSPWAGLTLATLSTLADYLDNDGKNAPSWRALAADLPWQLNLPEDERARIATAHRAFSVAEARAWLSPLAEQVRAAWQSMGGAATCADADARDDADAFFEWLHVQAVGGLLPPRHIITDLLDAQHRSFSSAHDGPHASGNAVEILTIHKAKGLEWDHVFLPGIDRKQRGDSRDLAQWRFTAAVDGEEGRSVLIAARDSRKKLEGSVYDYVSQHTRAARSAEVKRLLYVAVTRAKTTLTLTRCNAANAPATDSFSALLDDAADASFASTELAADKRLRMDKSLTRWQGIRQVPAGQDSATPLVSPAYPASVDDADLTVPQSQLNARAEGVVGHLLFEGLAAALSCIPQRDFAPNETIVKQLLVGEGADEPAATAIAARLVNYFRQAATSDNVKFLFSPDHAEAANELTLIDDNQDELRADRTFVTAAGVRWLVDFKFSEPLDTVALAAEVERYRPQLLRYVERLASLDRARGKEHPIRVALYFPWIDTLYQITL
jgi:ATP-dependent exoDNAse (exonuclease V) beta subunit